MCTQSNGNKNNCFHSMGLISFYLFFSLKRQSLLNSCLKWGWSLIWFLTSGSPSTEPLHLCFSNFFTSWHIQKIMFVWPTDLNRGGCLRAEGLGPGGLARQGNKELSTGLRIAHSRHTCRVGRLRSKTLILTELLGHLTHLSVPFQMFKFHQSVKLWRNF